MYFNIASLKNVGYESGSGFEFGSRFESGYESTVAVKSYTGPKKSCASTTLSARIHKCLLPDLNQNAQAGTVGTGTTVPVPTSIPYPYLAWAVQDLGTYLIFYFMIVVILYFSFGCHLPILLLQQKFTFTLHFLILIVLKLFKPSKYLLKTVLRTRTRTFSSDPDPRLFLGSGSAPFPRIRIRNFSSDPDPVNVFRYHAQSYLNKNFSSKVLKLKLKRKLPTYA